MELLENQEDKDQKRSTSLGIQNNLSGKSRGKVKLRELKDVRELRGTMCMPRVEDFLPKKQEIAPAFFHAEKAVPKQVKVFRRQKYSRNDVSI